MQTATVKDGLKCFMSSPSRKELIFSKHIGLWVISISKEFWGCGNFISSNKRKPLKLLQIVQLKKSYFESLPITNRMYANLHSLMYNIILSHCHSSFLQSNQIWTRNISSQWPQFGYILNKGLFVCLFDNTKSIWFLIMFFLTKCVLFCRSQLKSQVRI